MPPLPLWAHSCSSTKAKLSCSLRTRDLKPLPFAAAPQRGPAEENAPAVLPASQAGFVAVFRPFGVKCVPSTWSGYKLVYTALL